MPKSTDKTASGSVQRVIIPKGLVDPNATAIIEIPENFRTSPTVIAKPKSNTSDSSGSPSPTPRRRVVKKTTTTKIVDVPPPPRTLPKYQGPRYPGLIDEAASYGGFSQSYEPNENGFPWERSLAAANFYGDNTLENDFGLPNIPTSTPVRGIPLNGTYNQQDRTYPCAKTATKTSVKKTVVTTSYDGDISNFPSSTSALSDEYDIIDADRNMTGPRPARNIGWNSPEVYDHVSEHHPDSSGNSIPSNRYAPVWFRPELESSRVNPLTDASGIGNCQGGLACCSCVAAGAFRNLNRSNSEDRSTIPGTDYYSTVSQLESEPEENSAELSQIRGFRTYIVPQSKVEGRFEIPEIESSHDYSSFDTPVFDYPVYRPSKNDRTTFMTSSQFRQMLQEGSHGPADESYAQPGPSGIQGRVDGACGGATCGGTLNETFSNPSPGAASNRLDNTRPNQTYVGSDHNATFGVAQPAYTGNLNESYTRGYSDTLHVPQTSTHPAPANLSTTHASYFQKPINSHIRNASFSGRGSGETRPLSPWVENLAEYHPAPPVHSRICSSGFEPPSPTQRSPLHVTPYYTTPQQDRNVSRASSANRYFNESARSVRGDASCAGTAPCTPRAPRASRGQVIEFANTVFTVSPFSDISSNGTPNDVFTNLDQTEASEREQLSSDLRNWQDSRRKLIFDANDISTSGMSSNDTGYS